MAYVVKKELQTNELQYFGSEDDEEFIIQPIEKIQSYKENSGLVSF